jgi:hypothetical protein
MPTGLLAHPPSPGSPPVRRRLAPPRGILFNASKGWPTQVGKSSDRAKMVLINLTYVVICSLGISKFGKKVGGGEG